MTPEPRMHLLTLRFPGTWEHDFQDDYFAKSLRPVRLSLVVMALLALASFVQDTIVVGASPSDLLLVGIFLLLLAVTYAPLFRWAMQPLLALLVLFLGSIALTTLDRYQVDPGALTVAALDLVVAFVYAFNLSRLQLVYAAPAAALVGIAFFANASGLPISAATFGIVLAFVFTLVSGYLIERHVRREFVASRLLAAERERSERLLLNVLPAPIAARLKAGEEPIADLHPEVTVLFADLVGSTDLGAQLAPERLVETLGELFSAFDALAAEHGLEKIKTVGDAYMVVGGLPTPRPDHAEAVADMALDVQLAVAARRAPDGEPLHVRIGINTGPVVAGVIGTAKFAYDLWGDAVNTASRMESHGLPDAIQVTEATYARLKNRYDFVERGPIDVKGKGVLKTYLLLARRVEARLAPREAV